MKRTIFTKLTTWQHKPKRKPLLLKGARQVGKTYQLQHFGRTCFQNYHYINFEKQKTVANLFKRDLNPQRIINELNFELGKAINIENDLLIFDEIQACPEALTSLKYFCEDLPELALCAAGSLLGLQLNQVSFPVGKVDHLDMHPLSFYEFLEGTGKQQLVSLLDEINLDFVIPETAHAKLWEQLKIYFIVGGLPEVVSTYSESQNNLFIALSAVRNKQKDLIKDYYADIAKHSGKVNAMHIDRVWHAVPSQLAQEHDSGTNKFKFKGVIPGIDKYRRLANVIDWLLNTGLLLKVNIVDTCQQPLQAYTTESRFKLFMFDVGILGAMADLSPELILKYEYGSYKGYFAENFVCQELFMQDSLPLYNWQEKTAEVEFLKQIKNHVIPIEVKAGISTRAKSLKVFIEKYKPLASVILSAKAKTFDEKLSRYYFPLYLSFQIEKLLPLNE